MELKPGYKQTDLGAIPDDWETAAFEGIIGTCIDYRGRTPRKLGMDWGGGEILALSANNVQMGRIAPEKEAYLGSEELYRKWMGQGECAQGDVLLTMEAPLGNVAQIPDGQKYILSQRVVLIKPNARIQRGFLFHLMQGSRFQGALEQNSTGSTAKGIQRAKLESLGISFPRSTSEQSAIATALSDVDALLAAQDALIAKKRAIKQGAMQELLTGKRRLPGFSGEWEVKQLGDVLTIRHGKNQKAVVSPDGQFPILATSGQIGWASQSLYDKPSVLIGRKGTIDRPQYMETAFWTVDTLFYAELKDKNVAKYFYYRFCLVDWHLYNEASGVPSLNARTIERIELLCPKHEEQAAITKVLSDMDAEAAALDAQRAKTAQLKQGMMQELLTGRIRLV